MNTHEHRSVFICVHLSRKYRMAQLGPPGGREANVACRLRHEGSVWSSGFSLTLTTGAQNVRKLLILRSSIQKVFTTLLTLRQGDSRPGCKFVGAAEGAEPGAVAAIAIDDPSQVACSGEG